MPVLLSASGTRLATTEPGGETTRLATTEPGGETTRLATTEPGGETARLAATGAERRCESAKALVLTS